MFKSKPKATPTTTSGGSSTGTPVAPWLNPKKFMPILGMLIFACASIALLQLYGGVGALLGAGAAKIAVLILMPEGQIRSGKSGTVIWKRNNTMRIFAYPTLVRNTYTTFVRALLASLSSAWGALTQSQQNAWINAKGIFTKNRVGSSQETSGKNLYVKLNANLATIGVAALTNPPTPEATPTPEFDNTGFVADESAVTITSVQTNDNASRGICYEATAKVSAGVNRPGNSAFRIITAVADSTAPPTPAALWTAYVNKFGVLVAGDIFFIRATTIHKDTGQQSVPSLLYKVVVVA